MEAAFYIFITPQHTQLSLHSYHLAIYAKSNARSGRRPIRVTQTHTCPVVPPSSLLRKARCYTRYTQQVRLQSWRNPKDGILSTEVVFSVFTFFFFFFSCFFFPWGGPGLRGGSLFASWAETKRSHRLGGVRCARVHPEATREILCVPALGKMLSLAEGTQECSSEEGYRRAVTFLVCGAGSSQEDWGCPGSWGHRGGLPRWPPSRGAWDSRWRGRASLLPLWGPVFQVQSSGSAT